MNQKIVINGKGFTLVELVLVIALFGIIFGSTALALGNIYTRYSLVNKGHELVQNLREARRLAVAQKENSSWGIYLDTFASPQQFVLFKGSNYAGRDDNFDRVLVLSKALSFDSILLNGGGDEVAFQLHSGSTNQHGSFDLLDTSTGQDRYSIFVNELGLVDYGF